MQQWQFLTSRFFFSIEDCKNPTRITNLKWSSLNILDCTPSRIYVINNRKIAELKIDYVA